MSWPVYLVVALHVHSHICCVTGVMALKKTRFAHRHIVHCFSITIYLQAKIFPHFWLKLCWGWRNLRFCVGFRHFASLFDGSLTSLSWKAFVKSIWVIGEPTDGVTLVEKSCIMQLLHAFFSATGNIVRIDSCTDDTIPISLTVAIRFTDASVNCYTPSKKDDVIKWKHFPRYWPLVGGIHRSPVNSPHKGQWRGALMFSLICVWINSWVNNHEAGDLICHRAHYDVTIMVPPVLTHLVLNKNMSTFCR